MGDGPLRRLLDARLVVGEAFAHGGEDGLTPAERLLVVGAVPARRREFAAGRRLARSALDELGVRADSILSGPRGEPMWPVGVVGSITHCSGYVGVAVGRRTEVRAVGIDAEPDEPLPEGILHSIADPTEVSMVADLTASAPGPAWDRLVFCLKEVVFKVWYPLAGSWLDFDDAAVVVDRGSATFRATLLRPAPELAALGLPSTLQGSWVRHRGILVAAVRIDDLEGSAG